MMNRLFITGLLCSCLSLASCQENHLDNKTQHVLLSVLEKSNQKNEGNYDMITQGIHEDKLYYKISSGGCFPPPAMYYDENGDLFCTQSISDSVTTCNPQFTLDDTKVLFRKEYNCAEESPIDVYQIAGEN